MQVMLKLEPLSIVRKTSQRPGSPKPTHSGELQALLQLQCPLDSLPSAMRIPIFRPALAPPNTVFPRHARNKVKCPEKFVDARPCRLPRADTPPVPPALDRRTPTPAAAMGYADYLRLKILRLA